MLEILIIYEIKNISVTKKLYIIEYKKIKIQFLIIKINKNALYNNQKKIMKKIMIIFKIKI